jgi:hypothetical protein
MRWIVNRREVEREVDMRTSLLDLLREHLHLFGAKKGVIRARAAPAPFWSMASASIPASLSPSSLKAARSPRSRGSALRARFIPCSRRSSNTTDSRGVEKLWSIKPPGGS